MERQSKSRDQRRLRHLNSEETTKRHLIGTALWSNADGEPIIANKNNFGGFDSMAKCLTCDKANMEEVAEQQ